MHVRKLACLCVLASAAVALVFSCSTPKTPTYDRAALLDEVAHEIMLPGYETVATDAGALKDAISALCAAPDEDALRVAQAAFRTLFLDWQKTLAYRFGPARDDNLGPELGFAPANTAGIDAQIAGSNPITDAAIDALGGALKGLYALEYVLFDEASALAAGDDARRCTYTAALAAHVQRTSEQLADAWRPSGGGFADVLATAGRTGNDTYPAELSAISVVLTDVLTALEAVKDDKLGTPLGLTSMSGEADPDALESRYADLSLEAMQANLQGVQAVWKGTKHNFDAYLRTRNASLADQVLSQLSAAQDALAELPAPLRDYVGSHDHSAGQAAYDKLKQLVRTISADVDAALAVSLMFNENDGD